MYFMIKNNANFIINKLEEAINKIEKSEVVWFRSTKIKITLFLEVQISIDLYL
jgi:hypothetical protein